MVVGGDFVAAGVPLDDDLGAASGSISVFSLPLFALPFCHCAQGTCGNDGPLGGCASSSTEGASLRACGTNSVARDDLVLWTRHLPPHRFAAFVMGARHAPHPFGDGLRCVGRLG